MSTGLYSGVSGLALGTGLYKNVSGLWGGASGLVAGFGGGSPFGGASLYLNFLAGAPLDSRVTFSRGSNATLVDSTGKITYAPANLLLQSQTFDTASWTKLAATVTANTTVAPDDTNTADTINATVGGAGAPRVYQRPAITGSTTYTISSYFKASGTNFAFLSLRTAGGDWAGAEFNLSTGTVSRNPSAGNVAFVGATISDAGNGWYRCTVTVTPTDTVAAGVGFIFFGSSDGTSAFVGGFPVFINAGTESVFIWGAQLEQVTYQTTAGPYVATTSAAYYGPRFDYDPVTLAAKGLLIEEARTNLLLRSEEFDNAGVWVFTVDSVTANSVIAPSGLQTGDTFTTTGGGANSIYQVASVTAGAQYTCSVYVRLGTLTESQYKIAVYDVTNAAFIAADVVPSQTPTSSGWTRILYTFTAPAGCSSVRWYPFRSTATFSSSTVYLWGAQLEAGAFATSYIPTVASQVTRSADVATMTGTNFSSWYNQSEGTFVTNLQAVNSRLLSANDGTGSNRLLAVNRASATLFSASITDATVAQASLTSTVADTSAVNSVSLAYKENDFAFCANGGVVSTDNAGTVPTVNQLQIGRETTFAGTGHIRQIAYYNTRLTNTELETLTAPQMITTLSLDFINGIYDA